MDEGDLKRIEDKMMAVLVKQAIGGNATAAKEVLRRTAEQREQAAPKMDGPPREEVETWMRSNRRSYAAAVSHFHSTASEADRTRFRNRYKRWKREMRKSKPKLRVVDLGAALQISSMPKPEALASIVDALEHDIQRARHTNQVQLIPGLARLQLELLGKIWEAQEAEANPDDGLTMDEIIGLLQGLPQSLREQLLSDR